MIKNSILTLYLALNIGFVFAVKFKQPSNNPQELTLNNEKKMLQNETHLFEENKGQVTGAEANQVQFIYKTKGLNIFLRNDGLIYQFQKIHYPDGYQQPNKFAKNDEIEKMQDLEKLIRTETYRMDVKLLNSNSNSKITTEGKSSDYIQYYNHNALDVHSYSKVTYHDVYPNIDWVVYKSSESLKYDFVVHPGGNPNQIMLQTKWVENLELNKDGSILMSNRMGRVFEQSPISFQGDKIIASNFEIDEDIISFHLEHFNAEQTLVIDPTLQWATYYGGDDSEYTTRCNVDFSENVFIAGYTRSTFNIASGGHQNNWGGSNDAFLVKFNSSGVRLWATYYGAGGNDYIGGVEFDHVNNVYISGNTASYTNIATVGLDNSYGGGNADAFLVKFDSAGVRQWGTYYGGANTDGSLHCAVDNNGNVYIVGITTSSSNISSAGHQNNYGGGQLNGDAFLAKFDSTGTRIWATYYGGSNDDFGNSCAVDDSGNIYLAGSTSSLNNISSGGHQNTYGGASDAFLVKFNANGTRLWATYYGGTLYDSGLSCDANDSGDVFLVGATQSYSNIAFGGHQNYHAGGNDGMIVKFNVDGIRQWASYYGGNDWDVINGCVVDASGNIYAAGETKSFNNIAFNGYQNAHAGGEPYDAFLVKFSDAGLREWATYYGGSGGEGGFSCAVGNAEDFYLLGYTGSDSSIAVGGHQNIYGGGLIDAFLVKFGCQSHHNLSENHCDSFILNGQTYTSSGVYSQTLTNSAGCDSIINLNLTINQSTSSTITDEGCGNYILNGQTYTSSGNYTQNLLNVEGCDSIISLALTIYQTPVVSITFNGVSLETSPGYLNYDWEYNNNAINWVDSNVCTPFNTGNYEVVVTDSNGCTGSASLFFNFINVENIAHSASLFIYPNPSKDYVTIEFDDSQEKEIQLFDGSGKLVYQKLSTLKQERITTDNLTNGFYMIKVTHRNGYLTKPLLIYH